jgi:DNA-binding transcriptional MocR family regulator
MDLNGRATSVRIGLMEAQTFITHLGPWSLGKGSLQYKLTRAVAQAIKHGLVNPGIRLPSERSFAQALRVSRTTVVAVYDTLRASGWVESRSGSGTWISSRSSAVTAARSAAQAGVLASSPLLGLLSNQRESDVVDFALGTTASLTELRPELFTLPPDEYASLLNDYRFHPLGLSSLRQAVADYYTNSGFSTHKQQILVTNGAQQAIMTCAALYLQRGDTALMEDPAYFGALDAFRAVGARISSLPVGPNGVSPSVVRDRISATSARIVYLTPTFQNPTGSVMPRSVRKEISRIASELGVPVIDDGALADLNIDGLPPPPLATGNSDAQVLTIGSISKLICSGLRIGWVRAPEPIIQRLARLKSAIDLGSPLLTQAIAARLLGVVSEARKLRRLQLKPRRDLLVSLLRRQLPEWEFRVPSGGIFLWVKLPNGDAREYAQVALRHGVAVLPGPVMSATENHVRFLRVPFLGSPAIIKSGSTRLATAWRDYESNDRRERPSNLTLV